MVFTKRLREGVRRGEITCSVRIWQRPRVSVGARYPMEEGAIEIDSIEPISFADITPELARESGFEGVIDLLKVAKHGRASTCISCGFTTCRQGADARHAAEAVARRLATDNSQRPTPNCQPLPTPNDQSTLRWELLVGGGWTLGVGNWEFLPQRA